MDIIIYRKINCDIDSETIVMTFKFEKKKMKNRMNLSYLKKAQSYSYSS